MMTEVPVVCPDCGLPYVTSIDRRRHLRFCRTWKETCRRLNYTPLTVPLEAHKAAGHQIRHNRSLSSTARAMGLVQVLEAQFERSLRHAVMLGQPWFHPSLRKYVAMVLFHEDQEDPVVMGLIEVYGVRPGLARGSSYYNTNAPHRRPAA